jgi:uncharacterized protein Veg
MQGRDQTVIWLAEKLTALNGQLDVMEEENGRKRDSLFINSIIILIHVLTLCLIIDLQQNFNIVYNCI